MGEMDPVFEGELLRPRRIEPGAGDTLWTPTTVSYHQSFPIGRAPESGQVVWKIEFILEFQGYRKPFNILWEEGDSESQIEDLMGWSAERTAKMIAEQMERQGTRLRPEELALRKNWGVRRELAGAFRDYRKWRKKIKESSTGKTLFSGVHDDPAESGAS